MLRSLLLLLLLLPFLCIHIARSRDRSVPHGVLKWSQMSVLAQRHITVMKRIKRSVALIIIPRAQQLLVGYTVKSNKEGRGNPPSRMLGRLLIDGV